MNTAISMKSYVGEIMSYLIYSKEKVSGVLSRIDFLLGQIFPYKSSVVALENIRHVFEEYEEKLRNASPEDASTHQLCCVVSRDVSHFLPVIELIANSSNVRTVFEFQEPFWELTSKIIRSLQTEGRTSAVHLIITSELRYTPFVTVSMPDALQNFIIICLPASEVHNPLLFPLAGHELGHIVWNVLKQVADERCREIESTVERVCRDIVGTVVRGGQLSLPDKRVTALQDTSLRHITELFCDCFGLRLFGEGFLYAFLYFFLPIQKNVKSSFTHPCIGVRFWMLKHACKCYNIPADVLECLPDYKLDTEDDLVKVYAAVARNIIALADRVVSQAKSEQYPDPKGSDTEKARILKSFEQTHPAIGVQTLADIINAGWGVYNGSSKEKVHPSVLFDLIAKSFEVMAIEKRITSYVTS